MQCNATQRKRTTILFGLLYAVDDDRGGWDHIGYISLRWSWLEEGIFKIN